VRFEDEVSGEIVPTRVHCRLFDSQRCRCTDYANRKAKVPDCVKVTPDNVLELYWLPITCGYRLVAFGKPLPSWHHLVCGDPKRVHTRGPSMLGALISEDDADWD
jgi:uncharacterized cysteine cluster protein YcgN (CxxCxxCC family)